MAARRQYTATMEPVAQFEKLVVGLAYHCGSDHAAEQVVLADGLAYNWRIAEEYFPEAVQILDWYHASEHLHQVAQICLGEEGEAAPRWVAARQEELMRDAVAATGLHLLGRFAQFDYINSDVCIERALKLAGELNRGSDHG